MLDCVEKKEVDSTTLINDSDTDTICYSNSDDEPYFYEDTGSESDESDDMHRLVIDSSYKHKEKVGYFLLTKVCTKCLFLFFIFL